VIGDPPSLIGGSHSKSTKSLSQSTILGAVVALGSSKNTRYKIIIYILILNCFILSYQMDF